MHVGVRLPPVCKCAETLGRGGQNACESAVLTTLDVSGVKAARTLTPVGTHAGARSQDGFILGSDI